MFCGILPWTWFSSSLAESADSLIAGGNLIKKVLFPAEVLPIVSVLANMVHFFLGLPILLAFLLIYQHYPRARRTCSGSRSPCSCSSCSRSALALFVSALTVHFRDIQDILANLLTLWFFATPIIYPWFQPTCSSSTCSSTQPVHAPRGLVPGDPVLQPGPVGHWKWLLALGAASVLLFLAGYWLFDRLRDSFAEAV